MICQMAQKILLLLTYLVMVEISRGHIIAIEEPENSINPGLLKITNDIRWNY